MKKTFMYAILAFMGLGIFYEMYANLNGASSQTGAPGELTCSQSGCHGAGNGEGTGGGLADNSGGGSVSISGISGTYVPGTLYHITVHVAQLGGTRFGFNCEALDISNGNAGTYSITQSGTWLRAGINGTRQGVSQGHSGTSGPTAGIGNDFFDFTFDWTAPSSSTGPITFYAAGVAINANGLNDSGDQVYYSSLTVNPSTAPAAQILLSRSSFTFPSFYALPSTTGNMQVFWAAGVGLSGSLTASVTGAQFQIATSASGPWVTSIPLNASGSTVNGTPIYVQYVGPATGTQTATVTVSGGGAASKSIALTGVIRSGGTAPSIAAPAPTSLNFGNVAVGSGPTTAQTFSFSFTNPVSALTVNAPAGCEVSTVVNRDYQSTLTLGLVGIGFSPTVYVRLKNPMAAGAYNGNITITTPGATTQSVAVSANFTMPSQLVLTSTDYLNLFTTNPGAPSATQTLSVQGTGLTSTLDVSTTNFFEVSLAPTSGFGSSVSITPSGGNVNPTTLYVRYLNPNAALNYGALYASSGTSATETVTLNGDCFGTPAPNVVENGTLLTYTTIAGTPSANQTFTVSGTNLTANLDVSAPTDFEVSLSSSVGFGSLVSLTPTSGSVTATTIYARYNPAVAGTTTSTITITSTGATTQTVAVTGNSITTAINGVASQTNIVMFPNPTSGLVNINTTASFQNMWLSVTDITGKTVYTEKLSGNKEQIDLGNQANGLYFISVLDADKNVISRQKFILKK